jgi:uncharacterized integral membrane protein
LGAPSTSLSPTPQEIPVILARGRRAQPDARFRSLAFAGSGHNDPAMAARSDEQGNFPAAPPPELKVGRTRTSGAWVVVVIALLVGLLMLVFILQNGTSQRMTFLWLHFTVPLGVGFLLAAILGGLLVVLIGVARIAQIRLVARRHARAEHTPATPPLS